MQGYASVHERTTALALLAVGISLLFLLSMQAVKRHKNGGSDDPNVLFYSGRLASRPDGGLIDDIHADWDGDWERLERHHGYIQWLFPYAALGRDQQMRRICRSRFPSPTGAGSSRMPA